MAVPPPVPDSSSPWWDLSPRRKSLVVFALLFLITIPMLTKIFTSDFGTHIAIGREIIQSGSVTDKEFLNYPSLGMHIPNGEWGFQALLYLVFSAGGVYAVSFLCWAVVFGIYLLLHRSMTLRGADPYLAVLAIFAFSGFLRIRIQPRPEIFTYLFTALTIFLFAEYYFGERKRLLYLFPPLILVWANMHPSYLIAFVLCGAFFVDGLARAAWRKELGWDLPEKLGHSSRPGRRSGACRLRTEPARLRCHPHPAPSVVPGEKRRRGRKFHPDVHFGTDAGQGNRAVPLLQGSGGFCRLFPSSRNYRPPRLPAGPVPLCHRLQGGVGFRPGGFDDGTFPVARRLASPDRVLEKDEEWFALDRSPDGQGPAGERGREGKRKRRGNTSRGVGGRWLLLVFDDLMRTPQVRTVLQFQCPGPCEYTGFGLFPWKNRASTPQRFRAGEK